MENESFWNYINAHRDTRIWSYKNEQWKLLDSVMNHANERGIKETALRQNEKCKFIITKSKVVNTAEKEYILIGRGWVDSTNGSKI